jgi:hypothetical protein
MFQIMRMINKVNDWNPTDKEYWLKNGWLDTNRPWQEKGMKNSRVN